MKTVKDLANKSTIPEGLIRAVVHQAGGWESFKSIAPTISTNKNCIGFEYHTETAKFFVNYRDLIRKLAHDTAREGGQSTIKMIHNLRCLQNNFDEDEIGLALYGPRSKINIQIANALTWFALEKVAKAYSDAL